MTAIYDSLWFDELYAFMIIAFIFRRSIVIPFLLWLYNYFAIESFFYYVFQGRFPPYSMPWISVGNSVTLSIYTTIFVVFSIPLLFLEEVIKGKVEHLVKAFLAKKLTKGGVS